jgi:histidine triad (HIT) family protein
MSTVDGCPFCPNNWDNLDVVASWADSDGYQIAVVVPLNPMVDGHVLFICSVHTQDASADPSIAAALSRAGAWWIKQNQIEANILANCGAAAGQTVFHTHFHVIPRVAGDDVNLPPWHKSELPWAAGQNQ